MEHAKNMICFSVTMVNVFTSVTHAMGLMTVAITVMNQRQMVLFVVCALDSFVPLIQIFSLLRLYSLIHAVKNMGLLGTALGRILCVVKQV